MREAGGKGRVRWSGGAGESLSKAERRRVGWDGEGGLVKEGGNRVACRDKEVECCR